MPEESVFSDNSVYYKIFKSSGEEFLDVACMQWFDEYDYDQSSFLTDEKFPTKEEAKKVIDKIIIVFDQTHSLHLLKMLTAEGIWNFYQHLSNEGECILCGHRKES